MAGTIGFVHPFTRHFRKKREQEQETDAND